MILSNLARAYELKGDFNDAISYYKQGIAIDTFLSEFSRNTAYLYSKIGEAYHSLGTYSQAISYYEKSLLILRKILEREASLLTRGSSKQGAQISKGKVLEQLMVAYLSSGSDSLYSSFPKLPWPPPKPSTRMVIDGKYFADCKTLGDYGELLLGCLEHLKYLERSFYFVPEGFALVTRLEQIESDGTPKRPGRWNRAIKPDESLSLKKIMEALFGANPGYYRLLIFIVTSQPVIPSEEELADTEKADELLSRGDVILDPQIQRLEANPSTHRVTAYIYEFELPESGEEAAQTIPSEIPPDQHLEKAGILQFFGRE